MRAWLPALGLLAACELPPLSLRFALTDGESNMCFGDTGNRATSCSDITFACERYISIRIAPPSDPTAPYISVCRPLTGAQNKLCAIAGIDLPPPTVPIPEQVLEVQMAIFPATAITKDPITDEPICPRPAFAADGFPVVVCDDPDGDCPSVPAIGGRTFYYPGDEMTVITLGCTDSGKLNMCGGVAAIDVTATVNEFEGAVSVSPATADRLSVAIGEPKINELGFYELNLDDKRALGRNAPSPVPGWSQELVNFTFSQSVCLEVLEDGPQATTALRCREATPGADRVDITGIRLQTKTLTDILTALGRMSFPTKGLVVGVVLDRVGNPVAGATVASTSGSVKYLSGDRTTIVTNATASHGIFISEDAPFGSTFSWSATSNPGFGGLVEGKVTIVIIQEKIDIGG